MEKIVKVDQLQIGNKQPLTIIAGPCQIESKDHAFEMCEALKQLTQKMGLQFIFKSSYDKANRTSISGIRGVGIDKGLQILSDIRDHFGVPVITDVHTEEQCTRAGEVVDVLQIPAFLCRQTDLLIAAAKTGKAINIKKGQFLAPWDMENVAKKVSDSGNDNIMLCERGASFGYNTLVSDMRSIPIMQKTGYPIIYDATHSVQQPGGLGGSSGGDRTMVPVLARAAVAVGVAGVFIETHQNPDSAPSDGPNMVQLSDMPELLGILVKLDKVVKMY
ncbi:MAG: 3-deoxy-8-phosphooctulonate synthase [Zetaproteobacteria bacterium]|nr:MAG: 3-deoxy-8-phosphooctulonate synthase [Zetaproteobacteria bacterium]